MIWSHVYPVQIRNCSRCDARTWHLCHVLHDTESAAVGDSVGEAAVGELVGVEAVGAVD